MIFIININLISASIGILVLYKTFCDSYHSNKYNKAMDKIKSIDQKKLTTFYDRKCRLTELSMSNEIYSHRQHLKSKYQEYVMNRRHSLKLSAQKQLTESSINSTQDIQMPRISFLTRDRDKIGESLRQTINRYNYTRHKNQKMMVQLNRKKKKYHRILKIRQEFQVEKMERQKSRDELKRNLSKEKNQLRSTVLMEKTFLVKSRQMCLNSKKSQVSELRELNQLNKSRILTEKKEDVSYRKRLRSQILSEQKKYKNKKALLQLNQRRLSTQNYYRKIQEQIKKNENLNALKNRTQIQISRRVAQLGKQRQRFQIQLKGYEYLMKEKNKKRNIKESNNGKAAFSATTGLALSQQV